MTATEHPLELARALISCASVTPEDAGALATLQAALEGLGFACHRLTFSTPGMPDIDNLYARIGTDAPHFCFAGHTDVVPVGDTKGWTHDPFGAEVEDGVLYGRGAVDMKGAIACFIAAASRHLAKSGGRPKGSISLLITGDEEGPAVNGTVRVVEWLKGRGETLDACLVGEPTNPERLGEMVKIGRRGTLNGWLTVKGTQGHTAYPQLADNPLPRLVKMLARLTDAELDRGTEQFQPSNLQLTTIDVGNPATNVIPAEARAAFNIRFNELHTGKSLDAWLHRELDQVAGPGAYELKVTVPGEAFLTPPGKMSEVLAGAIRRTLGVTPDLSTTGGTSDARYIRALCPVAEFGLLSRTMHKIDECVAVADLDALADVYEAVLDGFFAR